MSRSKKPQEFSNEMMFMEDSSNYKATSSRRHKIKRMEELSHSLDDGLNYIQDGYARGPPQGAAGRYDDYEDEDFVDDEYIEDDYYYNNKAFDGRPKSFNDKYSYMYDEYDQSPVNSRHGQENYRYNSTEPAKGHPRYNQSVSVQQQKQQQFQQPSTFRRTYDGSAPSLKQSQAGPSGNGSKHILFNDEDDVCYVADHKKPKAPVKVEKAKAKKPETKKEPSSPTSLFSLKKSKPKKEEEPQKSEKSGQVMKARLKLQNVGNDDSALQTRNSKINLLHRLHSVDSKTPAHGPERNMSPTILEEIEFENQDEDTDEQVQEEKEKPSKERTKDKKGALDSPTTKKSFKSHLTSHKKLFKVPDIDLNNLKFSCFFNSNKNIALGSKSTSTPAVVNTTSSKTSINSDRNDLNDNSQKSTESITKSSKEQKTEPKVERRQDVERKEIQGIQKGSRNSGSVQNSNENMVDNSSVVSDVEFEVIFRQVFTKKLENQRIIIPQFI